MLRAEVMELATVVVITMETAAKTATSEAMEVVMELMQTTAVAVTVTACRVF